MIPNQVKLLQKVVPPGINVTLKKLLLNSKKWSLSLDNRNHDRATSDNGFSITPYEVYYENNEDSPQWDKQLFQYADFVCLRCLEELNITNFKVNRFYYNLYTQSSVGVMHQDQLEDNFLSIVYDMGSDGFTKINDTIYYDKECQAKVFKSNLFHCGTAPQKDKFRFNLNIVLELFK